MPLQCNRGYLKQLANSGVDGFVKKNTGQLSKKDGILFLKW